MHVRRSRMLDRLVVGQSMETGTRLPKTPTGPSVTDTELNQLGDVCPVELVKAAEAAGGPRRVADVEKDKPGDEAWRYRCAQSVADTAFYRLLKETNDLIASEGGTKQALPEERQNEIEHWALFRLLIGARDEGEEGADGAASVDVAALEAAARERITASATRHAVGESNFWTRDDGHGQAKNRHALRKRKSPIRGWNPVVGQSWSEGLRVGEDEGEDAVPRFMQGTKLDLSGDVQEQLRVKTEEAAQADELTEDMEKHVLTLQDSISQLKQQLADSQAEYEDSLEQKDQKLSSANAEVTALQGNVAQMRAKHDRVLAAQKQNDEHVLPALRRHGRH